MASPPPPSAAWLATIEALLVPPRPLPHPLLCHPALTHESLTLFRALVPDPRLLEAYTELVTAIASLWVLAPEPHTLQPQLLNTSRLLDLASVIASSLPPRLALPSIPSSRHLFATDLWEAASLLALRLSATGLEGRHRAQAVVAQAAFFRVWRRLVPHRVTAFGVHEPYLAASRFLGCETVPEWDGIGPLMAAVGDYPVLRGLLHPKAVALLTETSALWDGPPADFDALLLSVLAKVPA